MEFSPLRMKGCCLADSFAISARAQQHSASASKYEGRAFSGEYLCRYAKMRVRMPPDEKTQ